MATWKRITAIRHPQYECRRPPAPDATPYDEPLNCLGQAAQRIQRLEQQHLKMLPITFCYPTVLTEFYRKEFAEVKKKDAVTAGIHGNVDPFNKNYKEDDEGRYLEIYAAAHFVTTQRKSGYDCNRHVEILGAGSMPLMADNDMDPLTMFHYPKECFPVFDEKKNEQPDQLTKMGEMVRQFHTLHTTCGALANFIFRSLDFDPCTEHPILFLDHFLPKQVDYASNYILIALKETMGPHVHIWRAPRYMYNNWTGNFHHLYGQGMGTAYVFDSQDLRPDIPDHTVVQRLRNSYYKAVVYGSWSRSLPFWAEVKASLPPHRIWAVNGADSPPEDDSFVTSGQFRHSTALIREMTSTMFGCRKRLLRTTALAERNVSSQSCLPPIAGGHRTTLPGCFHQAEHRIKVTRFNYLVFPISFCLSPTRIAALTQKAQQKGESLNRQNDAIEATVSDLASSQYLRLVHASDFDSILMLEALAAGSVPVYQRSEADWDHLSQFHHPKECIGSAKRPRAQPSQAFREHALQFLHRHLSCDAMAKWMFQMAHFDACAEQPILFIDTSLARRPITYTSVMVLTGLKLLLGDKVHVFPEPRWLYTGGPSLTANPHTAEFAPRGTFCSKEGLDKKCFCRGTVHFGADNEWGGGWAQRETNGFVRCTLSSFGGDPNPNTPKSCYCQPRDTPDDALDHPEHVVHTLEDNLMGEELTNEQVLEKLHQKTYKAVVYGNFNDNRPHFEVVQKSYPPERIWVVFGSGPAVEEDFGATQFVRQLSSSASKCYHWTTSPSKPSHLSHGTK